VSGDLFTDETGTPDRAYIDAVNHLVRMRPDITVIAYTHGWRTLPRDIFEGWAPRASCDSVAETAEAIRAGWSPVLVVPEDDPAGVIGSTVEGRRAVPCVYDTHGRQCVDCRLCSRQGGAVVVFRAHGSQRRHVKA
jgi:hypothetical protein